MDTNETTESPTLEFAGFWVRAAAFLLDLLFILVPASLLQSSLNLTLDEGLASLVMFAFTLTWYTLFWTSSWQATPGKRLMNIYVTDENGEKLTTGRAVGRTLGYYLSNLTFAIGYLMAGFTEEKTALHDILAKTRVRYGRPD